MSHGPAEQLSPFAPKKLDVALIQLPCSMAMSMCRLACYETADYQMKFKACMPAYVSWEPHRCQVKDPGFLPAGQDIRWFARHPNNKLVRTCTVEGNGTVGKFVQMLFPDLHANTPWNVFNDGHEVETNVKVKGLNQVEIQWNGARPFPVTSVFQLQWKQELDMPMTQAKVREDFAVFAIRSPFKIRMQELKCPLQMTIGEAAASFLALSRVQTSLLCSQNGMIIDPALKFCDVNGESVLEFRVCPLLGGGKPDKKEAIRNKLRAMLVERGVPEDDVGERVSGLMSKVPHDKFAALGDLQDANTWKSLKEIAGAA